MPLEAPQIIPGVSIEITSSRPLSPCLRKVNKPTLGSSVTFSCNPCCRLSVDRIDPDDTILNEAEGNGTGARLGTVGVGSFFLATRGVLRAFSVLNPERAGVLGLRNCSFFDSLVSITIVIDVSEALCLINGLIESWYEGSFEDKVTRLDLGPILPQRARALDMCIEIILPDVGIYRRGKEPSSRYGALAQTSGT